MAVRVRDLEGACRILNADGVLILPTDTLPGFHGRADSEPALDLIERIKGRKPGRPLVCLASSPEQAALITGELSPEQKALCSRCWPGPFSVILPSGTILSTGVTGGRHTVAVRVPDFPWLRALLEAVGFPLVSTSVNRTSEPPCRDLDLAVRNFAGSVQGFWMPATGEPGPGHPDAGPSALLDATVSPPRVLRPGPLPVPPPA